MWDDLRSLCKIQCSDLRKPKLLVNDQQKNRNPWILVLLNPMVDISMVFEAVQLDSKVEISILELKTNTYNTTLQNFLSSYPYSETILGFARTVSYFHIYCYLMTFVQKGNNVRL